jgi:hypothetical protein
MEILFLGLRHIASALSPAANRQETDCHGIISSALGVPMSESHFGSGKNNEEGLLIVGVDFAQDRVVVAFSDGFTTVYPKTLLVAHRNDPGTETLAETETQDGLQ